MVKRILRYLKNTITCGIQVSRSPTLHLSTFSDADWAGYPYDRKSQGGFLIFCGSNLISWQPRRQQTVALSSTESEYRALANAAAELTWLQSLFGELGIYLSAPPTLWCDNVGATYLTANPIFHARTKHVEVDFHFVRDKVAQKDLQVQFISSKDQLANILTKGLPSTRFQMLRSKLTVAPAPLSLRGHDKDTNHYK